MYLNGEMKIEIPEKREGNGKFYETNWCYRE
jgi:hypothetical protein